MDLTIVIPCYNEAENVPVIFPAILELAEKKGYRIIAVDDGSTDRTAAELQKFSPHPGFRMVSHKCNRGYGAALKTALENVNTEAAVTLDADGQHSAEDAEKCFLKLQESNADLVVGTRETGNSGAFRGFGKLLIRAFARTLLKLPVRDLNSGMKCFRMEEARAYFDLCPDTMAFSDVILLLMINDRKLVTEEPISVAPRRGGKSTISAMTAVVTIAEILNLSVLLRPLTTFCRLGIFFLIFGLGWGTFTYWQSRIISSAAAMLMIFSLFCFVLGLLCEQLSQIRRQLARKKR